MLMAQGGVGLVTGGLGIGCISERDLEVIHGGKILDNDDELEYCFTQPHNPLVVYVPTDLTPDEFREHTKISIDNLERFK